MITDDELLGHRQIKKVVELTSSGFCWKIGNCRMEDYDRSYKHPVSIVVWRFGHREAYLTLWQ